MVDAQKYMQDATPLAFSKGWNDIWGNDKPREWLKMFGNLRNLKKGSKSNEIIGSLEAPLAAHETHKDTDNFHPNVFW
jgi:hypothetical protein